MTHPPIQCCLTLSSGRNSLVGLLMAEPTLNPGKGGEWKIVLGLSRGYTMIFWKMDKINACVSKFCPGQYPLLVCSLTSTRYSPFWVSCFPGNARCFSSSARGFPFREILSLAVTTKVRSAPGVAFTQISAYSVSTCLKLGTRQTITEAREYCEGKGLIVSEERFVSLNRLMVVKVLLKCVISFSISLRCYAFPSFCTQISRPLAYSVRISSKASATAGALSRTVRLAGAFVHQHHQSSLSSWVHWCGERVFIGN